MLKVVHCITGLTGDGAQGMLLRLVTALAGHGVENRVISLEARQPMTSQFEKVGAPVLSLGVDSIFSGGPALATLCRFLSAESPDLLQGWMYHGNVALSLARKLMRGSTPLVWNIRRGLDDLGARSWKTRSMIWMNQKLSRVPTRIVYCTEQSMIQHETLGFTRGKGIVIGNGFDTERYRPCHDSRDALLSRLGLSADALVIGHLGRYDVAKGHVHLIEAFSRVLSQYPQARLVCAGRGVDKENRELTALVRRLGLSSCTVLLGECSHVEKLYPAFDIMCSSSIAEGFPNVVAEAMASGVPCVVTDTGASRALVQDIGLVVEPRSSAALGDALCALCARSSDERRVLGEVGRERIRARYSMRAVSQQYNDLYRRVCGDARLSSRPTHPGSLDGIGWGSPDL
jgi:glycosyltransferase involved in cell wall biosynthesis